MIGLFRPTDPRDYLIAYDEHVENMRRPIHPAQVVQVYTCRPRPLLGRRYRARWFWLALWLLTMAASFVAGLALYAHLS